MFRWHRRQRSDQAVAGGKAVAAHLPGLVEVIDDTTFESRTIGPVTVVEFSAPWCAPCRAFAPVFEAVAGSYQGRVRFATCDVDDSPRTAALLRIDAVPTVVVFAPDGSELARFAGVASGARLDAFVETVVAGRTA